MRGALIPTLAALATVVLTVSLGQWQLRRGAEKEALASRQAAAMAAAPRAVGAALQDASEVDGQRVTLAGEFVDGATVFLDNRTRQGVAGFHVLTPIRIETGSERRHVLVLRGWVERDLRDRSRLPPIRTPTGPVAIEGIAQAVLPQPMVLGDDPEPGPAERLWQRYTPRRYAEWSGLAMQPFVVRQIGGPEDGLARDWAAPGDGVDRHRGYAFQWFALATLAAGLWIVFVPLRAWRRAGQRSA
jgi:surfeit locus 1 family protein